jgi:uncharacterized protein (TIGR02646 family)
MIQVDISKFKPTDEWLKKSQQLRKQLLDARDDKAKRDKIIKANQKVWKELKEDLQKLSYGKCWYSGAREIFSYYHVDHFRPKLEIIDVFNDKNSNTDGYWWLAFEYTNYRLSGGVGNTKKSNHFAVEKNCVRCPEDDINCELSYFLDPTKPNDYKKLSFDEEGKIRPKNPIDIELDHKRAKYTIQYLNLDFPQLVEARQRKWKKVKILIDAIDIAEAESNLDSSPTNSRNYDDLIEEMRKMIAPCAELSATVKACLKASRREWALDLLAENTDFEKYCIEYSS